MRRTYLGSKILSVRFHAPPAAIDLPGTATLKATLPKRSTAPASVRSKRGNITREIERTIFDSFTPSKPALEARQFYRATASTGRGFDSS
jgi:hypothetical protein